MHVVQSYSGVPIRLPSERWEHISQNHPEMAGFLYDVLAAVEHPDEVRAGTNDARIAMKEIEPGKVVAVVYTETSTDDGFVITAFLTRELNWLRKKRKLWP
jgi:hypothetical protein